MTIELTLDTFVAKPSIKNIIQISIDSAQKQGIPLPHMLIVGNAGTGKTTLAKIVGKAMGVKMHIIMGQSITNDMQLINKLTKIKDNEILFIDEIHSLPKNAFEMLYSAMNKDAPFITVRIGNNVMNYRLKKFALMGATNMPECLSDPLHDRFNVKVMLDLYSNSDIEQIINLNTANTRGITFTPEAVSTLAAVCRGVPRIAINYVSTIMDYAIAKDITQVDKDDVNCGLDLIGIDSNGLNDTDRKILTTLYDTFSCMPVGIETLASVIGQSEKIIKAQHEPFLLTKGYLLRTGQGRTLTEMGLEVAMEAVDEIDSVEEATV